MIIALRLPPVDLVLYEQVARAPVDLPLICAAVSRRDLGRKQVAWSIALGGYGRYPLRLKEAEAALGSGAAPEQAAEAARAAFVNAEDKWASAEYRSAVAAILVRRLVAEAMGR
jgi:carbon-monoxide dehydrogenase medium subunit